jgi:nucleoside phosphorylase
MLVIRVVTIRILFWVLLLAAPAALARTVPVPDQIDDPLCALASTSCLAPPYVAVISAFPAEVVPLLLQTTVAEMVTIAGRRHFIGTLDRTPVVLLQGGIGMLNAADAAQKAVAHLELSALVFSGVAGSRFNIADVMVPETWVDTAAQAAFAVDASMLETARALAAGPSLTFESCTRVPPEQADAPVVCLPNVPVLRVGGVGQSGDPFAGPFRCQPGDHPVFGCHPILPAATDIVDDAVDMETAAVARVAIDSGLPFVGFRGVSDGDGDPLGLPGFPNQFLAYYQIAANNAAIATRAFLEARASAAPPLVEVFEAVRVQASCRWPRAAAPGCDPSQVPTKLSAPVTAACRLLARSSLSEKPARAKALARRARARWRRAARLVGKSNRVAPVCREPLAAALAARGATPP